MKNVLIIDDSRMFRKVLEKIVSPKYEVSGFASDGNEGFEQYKQINPNVTLLDITMPNCDGRECLKKIMDLNKSSVVIMISGIDDQQIVEECLGLGARGFINKSTIDASSEESRNNVLQKIESIMGDGNEAAA